MVPVEIGRPPRDVVQKGMPGLEIQFLIRDKKFSTKIGIIRVTQYTKDLVVACQRCADNFQFVRRHTRTRQSLQTTALMKLNNHYAAVQNAISFAGRTHRMLIQDIWLVLCKQTLEQSQQSL